MKELCEPSRECTVVYVYISGVDFDNQSTGSPGSLFVSRIGFI